MVNLVGSTTYRVGDITLLLFDQSSLELICNFFGFIYEMLHIPKKIYLHIALNK
jgi:hypothetical protein